MYNKRFAPIVLFLLLLIGCNTSPEVLYFTGNGEELLIQPDDLSPSWQLQTSWEAPRQDATEWSKLYIHPQYLNRPVITSATVFEKEEDAIWLWEELYGSQAGSINPCLSSLEQSAYAGNSANQFEVLCFRRDRSLERLGAYEYFVIARYGNVVSTFGANVINGQDMTRAQASEMGVLRQADMEALLRLIDERFQQANVDSQ